MKTQKRLCLLLLVILAVSLTVGCTADPVETTAPTENMTEPTQITTDPPTQPPTDLPTEAMTETPTQASTDPVDEELIAVYQELFDRSGDMMFNRAAGHVYTRAADVDLTYLFYNGVGYPGSWDDISDADRDLLIREGFWTEGDIQILPAGLLEEKLQRYFGVGVDEVKIPGEWAYSFETDTYYSNNNDAYAAVVTVTGYTNQPDGTVVLHLIVDYVHDHDWEEVIWDAPMEMTIRPVADGWQIISNVMAQ